MTVAKKYKALKKGISCGFTHVKLSTKDGSTFLVITHNGNMGNTIETSVDPNLNKIGFGSVAFLKTVYDVVSETGSPDYSYTLKLKA